METNNQNDGDTVFIVTLPSAISYRQCVLGEGETKEQAMADAFGPKPWPKIARKADCYEVTRDELQAMRG
tara:strand:- start:1284 stop:1493 length:210 start_codon:yes stop_codon:yes gene_type:complete